MPAAEADLSIRGEPAAAPARSARFMPPVLARRSSPRVLCMLLAGTAAAAVLFAATAGVVINRSQQAVRELANDAGPAVVDVARVRTALAAADRVAAASFLTGGEHGQGGADPEFQRNVTAAGQGLAGVAAAVSAISADADPDASPGTEAGPGSGAGSAADSGSPAGSVVADIQSIEELLVLYMGLVGRSASGDSTDPLAVAYLAYAADLMHRPGDGILARVDRLAEATRELADERATSGWLAGGAAAAGLAAAVLGLGLLVGAQIFLAIRFRRMVNPALCAATAILAAAAALVWAKADDTREGVAAGRAALASSQELWDARTVLAAAYAARLRSLLLPPDALAGIPVSSTPATGFPTADSPPGDGDSGDTGAAGVLLLSPADAAVAEQRFSGLLTAVEGGDPAPGEQADLRAAREAFEEFAALGRQLAPADGDDGPGEPAGGGTAAAGTAATPPDTADRGEILAIALGSGEGRLGEPFERADEALAAAASSAQIRFESAMDQAASGRWLGVAVPVAAGGVVVALLLLGFLPRMSEYRR